MCLNLSLVLRIRDLHCSSTYTAPCRSYLPIACLEPLLGVRVTALCSYWQNAIRAATVWGRAWFPGSHQHGMWGGLDAVSWCLELDDTSRWSEGCGCNGPSSPSNNAIITGQRFFLGCRSSLFPFCFSLHTSLLITFFGSGEIRGGGAGRGSQREPGWGHPCASDAAVLLILQAGLFGQDFFQKGSQIPP